MTELIKHLIKENFDLILSKSLINCHCEGLHSIMFLESPEKTIRLFVAEEGNQLAANSFANPLSVAFHSHHCNVTLHCIKGQFKNITVSQKQKVTGDPQIEFKKFLYQSKITQNEIRFVPEGTEAIFLNNIETVKEGEAVHMRAKEIHTVCCPANILSAWFVYEGKEDSEYKPYCWTNTDLMNQDFSFLYKPMDKTTLVRLLIRCGLIE